MSRGIMEARGAYDLFKPFLEVTVKDEFTRKQQAIEEFCHKVYLLSNASSDDQLLEIVKYELHKLNSSNLLQLRDWLRDEQFKIFIACSSHSLLGENIINFVTSIYTGYEPDEFPEFTVIKNAVVERYNYLCTNIAGFQDYFQGIGVALNLTDILDNLEANTAFNSAQFNNESFSICYSNMLNFSLRCFYDIPLRVAETIYDLTYTPGISFREGDLEGVPTALIALYQYFFEKSKPFIEKMHKDDGLFKRYFEILLITLYELSNVASPHRDILNQLYLSLVTLAYEKYPEKYHESNPKSNFPTFSIIAQRLSILFHSHLVKINQRSTNRENFLARHDMDNFLFNKKLRENISELDQAMAAAYTAYHNKLEVAPRPSSIRCRDYNEKCMMRIIDAKQQKEYEESELTAWKDYCREEDDLVKRGEYHPEFHPFLYRYICELKIKLIESNYQNSLHVISEATMPDKQYDEMKQVLENCKNEQIEEVKRRFKFHQFEDSNQGSLPWPLPDALSEQDAKDAICNTKLLFMLQEVDQFCAFKSPAVQSQHAPVLPPKVTSWSRVAAYAGFGLLACSGLAVIGAATAATFGLIHLVWLIPSVYFALGSTMVITAGVGMFFMNDKRRAKADSFFEKMTNKISTVFFPPKQVVHSKQVVHLPTQRPALENSSHSESPDQTHPQQEILPAPDDADRNSNSIGRTRDARIGSLPGSQSEDKNRDLRRNHFGGTVRISEL